MISKSRKRTFEEIFARYDYIMTAAQLSAENVSCRDIRYLLDAGFVEKLQWGYYHWCIEDDKSEALIISRLFPDAVLCMESALYCFGYIDKRPDSWSFAIDKNASRERLEIGFPQIRPYLVDRRLLILGETYCSIDGAAVRVYDRDRTICDVLRRRHEIGRETFSQAIQGYLTDSSKNIENLISYANCLHVSNILVELIAMCL